MSEQRNQIDALRAELHERYFAGDPHTINLDGAVSERFIKSESTIDETLLGLKIYRLDGEFLIRAMNYRVWRDKPRGVSQWQIRDCSLTVVDKDEDKGPQYRVVEIGPDVVASIGQEVLGPDFGPISYRQMPGRPRRRFDESNAYTAPRQSYDMPGVGIGDAAREVFGVASSVFKDLF